MDEVNGVPCCQECGRPLDNFESMTEVELLSSVRLSLLKDLARNLSNGTATHQEKTIARGLLRDNRFGVDQTSDLEDNDPTDDPEDGPPRHRPPRTFGESRG